jgi:hypothetical protein
VIVIGLWVFDESPLAWATVAVSPNLFGRPPRQQLLRFLSDQGTDEVSLGGGDGDHLGIPFLHSLDQRSEETVCSHSRRSGFHDVSGEQFPVLGPSFSS